MNTKEVVNFYLDNGILLSTDILSELHDRPLPIKTKFSVLNRDILTIIAKNKQIVIEDFERALVLKEKHKNSKLYDRFMEYVNYSDPKEANGAQEMKDESELKKSLTSLYEEGKIPVNLEEIKNIAVESKTGQDKTVPDKLVIDKLAADKLIADKEKQKELRELFYRNNRIKIVSSYTSKSRKWSVHDFVNLYNARYKELEKILRGRQELQNLTSISRIIAKKERENVALIGVVYDKAVTKTGNIMLTIEDPTGMVKALVNKSKEELFRFVEEIQLDETIGVTGMFDQILFINNLFIPDIPLTKELKKSPEEGYFVVISDTQMGSKLFLDKEFNKFLLWLNGEIGTEKQRDVASKVKYVFLGGDLVDGVGIYPNQEFDLNIIDIRDQYTALAVLLKQIPERIPIFICPGNHDVGRISEPQPPLTDEYAAPIMALPNIVSVSNPSTINIYAHPESGFDGFDIMFYHGYSFVYYSEHIPTIRKAGGQKRPDLIMKYLLQRRHLAPSHTSTLYVPDPKRDPLVIDKVPDFLISGHVHRSTVSNYKNVTCINASCWVSQSDEQERRGLEAQPGRAFIVDMRTREVKIMNFLSKEEQDKEQGITPDAAVTALSTSAATSTVASIEVKKPELKASEIKGVESANG